MTLLVEPGRRVRLGGGSEFVGVPFGATARLLLVYLQTQALCTKSRHVELGGSMRAWFDRLEKVPGGKSYRLVRDQAERIAMAKFSFQSERDGVRAVRNTTIVEEGLLFAEGPHGFGTGATDLVLSQWPALLENWMRAHGWFTPATPTR